MKQLLKLIFPIVFLISCETKKEKASGCLPQAMNDTIEFALESKWLFLGYVENETGTEFCVPESMVS